MRPVSPQVPTINEQSSASDGGNSFERSFESAIQDEKSARVLAAKNDLQVLQLPMPRGMSLNGQPDPVISRPWRPFESIAQPTFSLPGTHQQPVIANVNSTAVPTTTTNGPAFVPSASVLIPDGRFAPLGSYRHSYARETLLESSPPGKHFISMPMGAGNESTERRLRSQERNRLAAMKSRQRKKKEWERLLDLEKLLSIENDELKKEVTSLRDEVIALQDKLEQTGKAGQG